MCALDAAYQSDICPRHCRARMWGKVTEEADVVVQMGVHMSGKVTHGSCQVVA